MTLTAAIFIFISVFMHATWNILSKATKPSTVFYSIMNIVAGIIWIPFFFDCLPIFQKAPPEFYGLLIGSVLLNVIYMYGLAHGYKHGDISMIYPLVRSLPVVMVAVFTLCAGVGKPFGFLTLCGMVIITAGCIIMPFASFRNISFKSLNGLALVFVFIGAVGSTGYTLCDSVALDVIGKNFEIPNSFPFAYLFLLNTALGIAQIPLVVFSREERSVWKSLLGKQMMYPVIAGICCSGAYVLILFAMQNVTNVSYVQAFRQLSLPIGFLFGILFLHEKISLTKITGLFLILLGLLIVTFTK